MVPHIGVLALGSFGCLVERPLLTQRQEQPLMRFQSAQYLGMAHLPSQSTGLVPVLYQRRP